MPHKKNGKKNPPGNKKALTFAIKHSYRTFPICSVAQVHSGEVVDLVLDLGFGLSKKEKIRLSGVQAPSIRTKAVEEKELGEVAKMELETLLRAGTKLECVVDGKDGMGRTTAVLFVDEFSINSSLLNRGFVWPTCQTERDLDYLRLLQGNEF